MRVQRLTICLILATAALCSAARADSFRRLGTEFSAKRPVVVPDATKVDVVVCEFLGHGLIDAEGRNVVVCGKDAKPTATRVLQVGPGDFCRVAFQTLRDQNNYEIFYGGDPPTEAVPPWTARAGLLLETREYKTCNLNSLDSVREAFHSARPQGANYVDGVFHSYNPIRPKPGPFLSRYSGYLKIDVPGKHAFWTSSQDCSFLLIDGKLVASAPGRHSATRRAMPKGRKDVHLSGGLHKFEYYHAASSSRTMMAAVWKFSPVVEKPKPERIPAAVFQTSRVARVVPGPPSTPAMRMMPDFTFETIGDVPLPDLPDPLIRVKFENASVAALLLGAKVAWDFGDGQTAEGRNAEHVYLRPGVYAVKLSIRRGSSRPVEITNRIEIDRPVLDRKATPDELKQYVPIIAEYDSARLDAAALRQLVAALETFGNPAAAVAAGREGLVENSAARDERQLVELAKLIGPMARDRLGESKTAGQIWHAAAKKVSTPALIALCEVQAADIALNDLVSPTAAKMFLEAAEKHLPQSDKATAAVLQRVFGDYYALTGDGKAARAAYSKAGELLGTKGTHAERTAWHGAHSRSTEEYIRTGEYDRAAAELRAWQDAFPEEKIDGYITLLFARYFSARDLHAQAVAQSEQLQAVNPDSPYADRLLFLAAESELKRDRKDRAIATLHSLVTDYPGSPLVAEAKKKLAELEGSR